MTVVESLCDFFLFVFLNKFLFIFTATVVELECIDLNLIFVTLLTVSLII